jgi:GH18 family chitinase
VHILSGVFFSITRRVDAKLAADLAAAAHEETLQHLRDKAAATVALKHKEFKMSIAHVADTHAARAVEIRTMFTEMVSWYVCFFFLTFASLDL